MSVIATGPSGLVVVRQLDPDADAWRERLPALIEEYHDRPVPCAPGDWPDSFNVLENNEAGWLQTLGRS